MRHHNKDKGNILRIDWCRLRLTIRKGTNTIEDLSERLLRYDIVAKLVLEALLLTSTPVRRRVLTAKHSSGNKIQRESKLPL